MKFQDLNPLRNLPYIRSNNKKIVALLSFVLILLLINIFVIYYGKTQSESVGRNLTANRSDTDTNLRITVTPQLQAKDKKAEIVIQSFLDSVNAGKIKDAEALVSEYSSGSVFEKLINEGIDSGKTVNYKILGTQLSPQGNYAYITVEHVLNGDIQYRKYTLIKINSSWKLMSFKVL